MTHHTSQPHKLITVILPKGRDRDLIHQLVHELGINSVNINNARGIGRITPLRHRGVGETTEKAILTVVVAADRADEVFEYIFFNAEINRPHGGLMFQQPLLASTLFTLPDIAEEK